MKRLIDAFTFTNPIKIIVIGGVCSGKTTLSKLFGEIGFKHISIDKFRYQYSNGTIEGENKAYNEFIKYANNYENHCIIECTGLSYRYNEIEKRNAHYVYLECENVTAKFRQVERELQGYPLIPFPYQIKENSFDISNVEFENKIGFPLDLMNMYNTDHYTSLEIFANLLIRLGHFDSIKQPKTQKELYQTYKYREHENTIR